MNLERSTSYKQDYRPALVRLYWFRIVAVIAQIIVFSLTIWVLRININVPSILIATSSLILINGLLFWRLKQEWKVDSSEVAFNLAIDIIVLAILLYFTGGSTNPLVSLFIVPVALSAVFLPAIYLSSIVLLTIFLYSLLMQWYIPLPPMGSRFGGDFNLHIIGMYGNFIFSAIIIAIFIYILSGSSRKHQQALANAREKIIRNQHVVETGLLAANAAHEINTPLSTINMLTEEVLASNQCDTQTHEDVSEIQKQVMYCKKQLHSLQQRASLAKENEQTNLRKSITDTINDWSELHNKISVDLTLILADKIMFAGTSRLMMNLVNLMDNAADASLKSGYSEISVTATLSKENIVIDVDDYGEGLTQQQLSKLGKKPYTSKPEGMGIGLLLSHTALDHLGGYIILNNHKDSKNKTGIRARITVPLKPDNHE